MSSAAFFTALVALCASAREPAFAGVVLADVRDEPRTCEAALAALDADLATQREAGERWLAQHLAVADAPRVRTALARASAECRLRVCNALATASAGFELAVQLAIDPDAALASTGRDALFERVVRWSPGWAEPAATRGQVLARLNETPGHFCTLDARRAEGRVDLALGVLARGAPGLPPLVLAPGAQPTAGARARREPIAGLAATLVGSLAREHELTLAGFDFAEPAPHDAHPWILFHASADAPPPAAELVVSWCTLAARANTPDDMRRAAARALGGCGWPDALGWLAQRWSESAAPRELAWLDGILAAVDRAVVAPLLREHAEQTWLYAYVADPALEARPELRRERLSAIARALAAAGPRTSDGGEAGAGVPLPAETDALAQWVQFAAWEGRARLGAEAAAFLDARITELGRGARPELAPLLVQALSTRATTRVQTRNPPRARPSEPSVAPLVLEQPEFVYEWGSRTGRVAFVTRALAASGCAPPARWDDPAVFPRAWPLALRTSALAWELAAGSSGGSVRHLGALVAAPESGHDANSVRERLHALKPLALDDEHGAFARTLAALASESAASERLSDSALWSVALDVCDPELATRAVSECSARAPLDALAASVLGARAAHGDSGAQSRLLAALTVPAESNAAALGLDWAVERLRDSADAAGERTLVLAVRRARGGRATDSPSPGAWPAPIRPVARDLGATDRELPAQLPGERR